MNIQSKLIITYLLIAFIPLIFIAMLGYANAREALITSEKSSLEAIADLKKQGIDIYFTQLRNEVAVMQDYYNIKINLPIMTRFISDKTNPNYRAAKKMLDAQLGAWKTRRGDVLNVMLANLQGEMVYSLDPAHENDPMKHPMVLEATTSGVMLDPEVKEYEIQAAAPIRDFSGNLVGSVFLEASTDQLYAIVENPSGFGRTRETFIGFGMEDSKGSLGVVCSAPLTNSYPVAQHKPFVCQTQTYAVSSQAGGFRSEVGESVLAAWRSIPDKNLTVIVKVDAHEVLLPARTLAGTIFILGLISVLFILFVAVLFARAISIPMQELTRLAGKIGAGDLKVEFSEQLLASPGEIGKLARTLATSTYNLRASYENLEQKVRDRTQELTEFASLVSHQLKSPVSSLRWYTEMLLGGDFGKLAPKQREVISDMHRENIRMNGIINALLNLSRIEQGVVIIEPVPTNISEVGEDVLKEMTPQIKKKQLVVEKKFDKNIKQILIDPNLLRIIFQNFISNAIKYAPNKGKITVTVEKQAREVVISVVNSGEPIPEEDQPKIYQKMFRASNAKKLDPEGHGLGLYMVKKVTDIAGGRTWFTSKAGEDTVFSVAFPLTGMIKKAGTKGLV